jgi:hypothetical protein
MTDWRQIQWEEECQQWIAEYDKHYPFTNERHDMPKINEMKHSKYLKKEDCEPAILVTIKSVQEEEVGTEESPETKWTMYFNEQEKGIVLNWTNIQLCAKATGSESTDDWIGKKIVLYNDPSVDYMGKLTGGIRIRAPKSGAVQQELPPNTEADDPGADFDDDIPF